MQSVIGEANSEIDLLKDKLGTTERELEGSRRAVRELAEREKELVRETQRLQNAFDKAKQRALLAPTNALEPSTAQRRDTRSPGIVPAPLTGFASRPAHQPPPRSQTASTTPHLGSRQPFAGRAPPTPAPRRTSNEENELISQPVAIRSSLSPLSVLIIDVPVDIFAFRVHIHQLDTFASLRMPSE